MLTIKDMKRIFPSYEIEQTDSQWSATRQHFVIRDSPVLILFVCFSILGTFMVYAVATQPGNLDVLGGALIAWGLWLFSFLMSAHLLFGKTKIVFDVTGCVSMYTCLAFVYVKRRICLVEICCFTKEIRYDQQGLPYYLLRVGDQDGKTSFDILSKESEEELDNLCEQLNAFLETLKPNRNF